MIAGAIMASIGKLFLGVLNFLKLAIDAIVFIFIQTVYDAFNLVAKSNYLDAGDIASKIDALLDRIYIVIGVCMLFFLAYRILVMMADPEKITSSGDNSMQGMAKNFVISIILITVVPTAFKYLTHFQVRFMEAGVIEKIVYGDRNGTVETNAGTRIALAMFSSFYYPVDDNCPENGICYYSVDDEEGCPDSVSICPKYKEAYRTALTENNVGKFIMDGDLKDALDDGQMEHIDIVPLLAGGYTVFIIAAFTLDVAVRAVKLLFLRIIAPIPILGRITKSTGGSFDKWLNEVKDTYLSLFIRIAVINFIIYTIQLILPLKLEISDSSINWFSLTMAKIAIILGLLQFASSGPKLLQDILGLKGIDIGKDAIKNRLNENPLGRKAIGAAAVGLGTAGVASAKMAGKALGNFMLSRKEGTEQYKARQQRIRDGLEPTGWRKAGSIAMSALAAEERITMAAAKATAQTAFSKDGDNLSKVKDKINANVTATEKSIQKNQEHAEAARKKYAGDWIKGGLFAGTVGAIDSFMNDIPERETKPGEDHAQGHQKKDWTGWVTTNVAKKLGATTDKAKDYSAEEVGQISTAVGRGTAQKFVKNHHDELDREQVERIAQVQSNGQASLNAIESHRYEKVNEIGKRLETTRTAITTAGDDSEVVKKTIEQSARMKATADARSKIVNEIAKTHVLTELKASKPELKAMDDAQFSDYVSKHTAEVDTLVQAKMGEPKFIASIEGEVQTKLKDKQVQASIETQVKATVSATATTTANALEAANDIAKLEKQSAETSSIIEKTNVINQVEAESKAIKTEIKQRKTNETYKSIVANKEIMQAAYDDKTVDGIMKTVSKTTSKAKEVIYNKDVKKNLLEYARALDPSSFPGKSAEQLTPDECSKLLRKAFVAVSKQDIRDANNNPVDEDTKKKSIIKSFDAIKSFEKQVGKLKQIADLDAVVFNDKPAKPDKKDKK